MRFLLFKSLPQYPSLVAVRFFSFVVQHPSGKSNETEIRSRHHTARNLKREDK